MLNIGFISLDILILIVVFLFLFFYSMKKGKKLLITLILSIYPALLIFTYFPYINFEPEMPEAISFLAIYAVIASVVHKYVNKKNMHTPFRKVTDYGLLSLTYIILMLSVSTYAVNSLDNLYTFSGIIPNLITKVDFGLILILPLVLMMLTSKSDKI